MPKGAIKYIVGGSLVLLGIILMIIAFCIGGTAVFRNGFNLEFSNIYIDWNGLHIHPNNNQIDSSGGVIGMDNIKNLNIDFDYGEMIIKTGDVDEIKIDAQNVIQERFKYEEKGDTLNIRYDRGVTVSFFGIFPASSDTKIVITVPEVMTFGKLDIDNGAGRMTLEGITADTLIADNGAGEMNINNVTLTGKLDIDGGAGAIKIKDTICGGIDADIGVGELNFTGEINGDGKINSGIGAVYMTLYGDQGDYSFKTDSGIGRITSPGYNSGAKYTFNVSSGIGEVKITMKSKED